MSEVRTRILAAVVLIPLALFALYHGGLPLVLALYVVASIGMLEYILMLRKVDIDISCRWVFLNSALYLALVHINGWDMPLLWLMIFIVFVEALVTWDTKKTVPRSFATLFGLVYTGLFPALITRIGLQNSDKKILLALILTIWIVDSTAYFVGMKFGKNRNITVISPKKSAEGFAAGVLAPWVIVVILYIGKLEIMPFSHMVLLAIAAGVFGQLGDLVESMLKRYCDVKDSSNLIPGHGGILDRSDSILLAGSFLYCALEILVNVR